MEIVIVGGGKVGERLCVDLANEGHDITLIDIKPEKIENLIEYVDIKGVIGNGAVLDIQIEADVPACDVFIAVTPQDETNIMATTIAKRIGAKFCVARVRNPQYTKQMDFVHKELGISLMINPEQEAAIETIRAFDFPSALEVEPVARSTARILKFRIEPDSRIVGQTVAAIRQQFPDLLICIVQRQQEVFLPEGNTLIQALDEIHVVGSRETLIAFMEAVGLEGRRFVSSLIVGGGRLARYLIPMLLKRDIRIKVIERDKETAANLAVDFPEIEVIVGDGTSQSFLREERFQNYDTLIALTNIDEENLLLSMFAGQQGVLKTITKVNRTDLLNVIAPESIDTVITPREAISDMMIRVVRSLQESLGGELYGYTRLANGMVEVLEFIVGEEASLIAIPIDQLQLKQKVLVGLIMRGSELLVPTGNDWLEAGDHVLIISMAMEKIRRLEEIVR